MNDTQAQTASDPLLVRTVSLLILFAAVDLWCTRHLGRGMTDPRWLGALAGSLGAAAAILDFIAPKRDKTAIPNKVRDVARVLLSPKGQIVAYLVIMALGATLSSVVVIPESIQEEAAMRLTFLDSEDERTAVIRPGGDSPRFLVRTTPFGRTVEIKLDGYLPRSFDVFPLVGATVRPAEDLLPSPTLLIRPHWKALRSLENNGKLVVRDADGAEIAHDTGSRSSFLVGRSQSLPASSIGTWSLELSAEPGVVENVRARTLLEWSRPKHLVPSRELEPGMTLTVEVVSVADKVVAEATIHLGRERLVDLALMPVRRAESP